METYSSFANSEGGLIVLGVEEDKNHQLHITGINHPDELVRDFWNTINNQQKISLNILTDKMEFVIDVNRITADKPLKSDVAVPLSGKLSGKTSEKTTEKTTEKILCIIKNNPSVTYRELAEVLEMTEDGIYWSVKQLRKQGLLHRIGGRKEGYWQVVTQ